MCLLLLVVCALAVVPTVAMADTTASANDIIYFLNPTSIAVVDDYLFVADNIEEGKSVILSFDVSGASPTYNYSLEVDGNVTNLSAKDNSGLYAVMNDKVVEYAIADSLAESKVYSISGAINFVYGAELGMANNLGEYYITSSQMFRKDPRSTTDFLPVGLDTLANIKDILALGDYVYYLYQKDGESVCKRYNGTIGATEPDAFNTQLDLSAYDLDGMFTWQNNVALFSKDELIYVETGASISNYVALMSYDTDRGTIVDVVASSNKLFVLNSNHKVEIYYNQEGNFTIAETIGTERLGSDVPNISDFNSFTLVKSKGYPTNIIFMTTDEETSIEKLEEGVTDEYIILGYDGEDAEFNFYYVLYGDKFGWVKKSDDAIDVEHDDKLQIVDTYLSQGIVEYKAKLMSLNAVYVYPLPRESFTPKAYTQSGSSMTEVIVLQRFTENDITWYYVDYGEGKGFVQEETLGYIYIDANLSGVDVVGQRKINSTLFEAVKVYDNATTMTDKHLAKNVDGNEIKLYSGTRVTVVSIDNGVAFIQIVYGDGALAYGYIKADRLIDVNKITTNAVVGLTLLAIALVLTAILVVVFLQRRKKNAAKSDSKPNKDKKNPKEN